MNWEKKLYGAHTLPFETFASPMLLASANLRDAFEKAERDPISNHNEIVILVVLFLLVVTGVRFTVHPFCFLPRVISDDLSVMYAEDKIVSAFHASRIVALPSFAEVVLVMFSRHLRQLVSDLASESVGNLELAAKVQALLTREISREEQILPYFFLLNDSHHAVKLNREAMKKGLAGLVDHRLKEFRPQLCQFLLRAGAPRHLVAFQMGHMKGLRPAFSRLNQLTVLEFGLVMQPFLDLYVEELGWEYE
jgi:hypothetical protein